MSRGTARDVAYEEHLSATAAVLASSPMTVLDVVEALSGSPAACSKAAVYSRIAALKSRGFSVSRKKRRGKIAGKPGSREWVFSVTP